MPNSIKYAFLLLLAVVFLPSCQDLTEEINPPDDMTTTTDSTTTNTTTTTTTTTPTNNPPPELISQYTLTHTRSIGVPVSNPKGIATDQTNLWILSGEHNGDTHELTYYDPVNYTILRQFNFTNLIEVLGTGVYGLTWDGNSVWISVSGNTNKLVRVDPIRGLILHTWSSPTFLGPSDLEWDGDKIWISSGTGEVYTMDPTSGGTTQHLNLNESARESGIAFRNGEIWLGELFRKNIHIYDASDMSYKGVIKDGINFKGSFCFHNGELAVLSDGGVAFYEVVE